MSGPVLNLRIYNAEKPLKSLTTVSREELDSFRQNEKYLPQKIFLFNFV